MVLQTLPHDQSSRNACLAAPFAGNFAWYDLTSESAGPSRARPPKKHLRGRSYSTDCCLPANFSPSGWQIGTIRLTRRPVSGDYCDLFRNPTAPCLFRLGTSVRQRRGRLHMLMSIFHATFASGGRLGSPLTVMWPRQSHFSGSHYAGPVCHAGGCRRITIRLGRTFSAGQPPCLATSPARDEVTSATGVPLGMFANASFPVIVFFCFDCVCEPAHLQLTYTDGRTRRRRAIRVAKEYGMQRVKGICQRATKVRAWQDLRHWAFRQTWNFYGRTRHYIRDDFTVLAVNACI